jgi:hypothetical protein
MLLKQHHSKPLLLFLATLAFSATAAAQISETITTQNDGRLPPDPGDAGKATLLGIDSDMDGVRDDIQRYISLTYPNQTNLQNALLQLSRTYQLIFDTEKSRRKEAEIANKIGEDIACFYYVAGKDLPRYDILNDIEAEILNTSLRTKAYLEYDQKLAGQVFPGSELPRSERHKHCRFDL